MSNVMKKTEKVYIILLFVYLLLNSILSYNLYISSNIRLGLSMGFILTGGFILFYKIIFDRTSLFGKHSIILYVFLIAYIISSFTMIEYGYIDNIKTILWMCIIFGIIYNHGNKVETKEQKKGIKILYCILSIMWDIAIVYGLYQFANGIGYTIKYDEFVINKAQGFFYNRLFGIFMDPNYAAAISGVLLLTSIYLIIESNKKTTKIISALNGVLQLIYIILSGSRTAILVLACSVCVIIVISIKNLILKNKNEKNFKKNVIVIFIVILLAIASIILLKQMLPYISNYNNNKEIDKNKLKFNNDNITINVVDNNEDKKISLEREDLKDKEDSSNMRLQLWNDCIQIWKSKMIFGTSSRNFISYAKIFDNETLPAKGYDCGNGFLSVLIYSGIVGVAIILTFITKIIYKIIKYIIREKNISNLNILLLAIISAVTIEACINQQIFFINSLNTAIFWICLGCIMNNIDRKENNLSKKEKIGVVTIHDADNYGSDLQAFATQRVIDKLGYDTYIIDHKCKKIASEYGIKRIFAQKNIKQAIETIIRIMMVYPARRNFIKFRDKYYKLKPKNDIQENYKKFIVGSDQVWNYKITGMDKDYFLDFVNDDNKKIAYSSSFGITEIPEDLKQEYSEMLKKFKNIAVREKQAANIIENLIDKEVPVVLDPTLLLDEAEWEAVSNMPYKEKGYILCYQIAHSNSLAEFAEELSKKTGKKIISIQGSLRQRFNAKYIWNAGPSEYIALIKNADYVVTNSFHGTAFSINLNKNFFTEMLPSREKTSSRLKNILESFNLKDREIVDGKNENIFNPIDFEKVNNILKTEREKSIKILENYINEI